MTARIVSGKAEELPACAPEGLNMQTNNTNCSDTEPVYIGKIIEDELRRQERSVTWLSRKIHCARRNIYSIFSRPYIDTELLYRLSVALNTDFFQYYSQALQLGGNQDNTPPGNSPRHKLHPD